jgi:hypothetical protein
MSSEPVVHINGDRVGIFAPRLDARFAKFKQHINELPD